MDHSPWSHKTRRWLAELVVNDVCSFEWFVEGNHHTTFVRDVKLNFTTNPNRQWCVFLPSLPRSPIYDYVREQEWYLYD